MLVIIMPRFFPHLRRRRRPLLLGLCAAVMFGLWFGLWVRVLPLRPRFSVPAPDHTEVVGVSNDGQRVVTRVHPPLEPLRPTEDGLWPLVSRVSTPTGPVRVWDMKARSVVAEFLGPNDYCTVQFTSPDGRFIFMAGGGSEKKRIFDASKGRELDISPLPDEFLSFSPNGRYLAMMPGNNRPNGVVVLWDLWEEREQLRFGTNDHPFVFSSDSCRLAFAVFDREIGHYLCVVKEVVTGNEVRRFPIVAEDLRDLRFSPDDSRLAVVTNQWWLHPPQEAPWNVIVYDLDSGLETERHRSIRYFNFSPSGASLIRTQIEEDLYDGPSSDREGYSCPSPRRRYLMKHHWGSSQRRDWWDALKASFGKDANEDPAAYVKFRAMDTGELVCKLEGCPTCRLSDNETIAACIGPGGDIQVWDLPPRRPVALYLLFSALPALLFTGVLWWRVR